MKTCTTCGQEKPFDKFQKNPRMRDGHHSWCRACQATFARNKRNQPDPAMRCLYANCHNEGIPLPQGLGFRFCGDHRPMAEYILTQPKGAPQPVQQRVPDRRVAGDTWKCGHSTEEWNTSHRQSNRRTRRRCKACQQGASNHYHSPHLWPDKQAAKDTAYQKLKEQNT